MTDLRERVARIFYSSNWRLLSLKAKREMMDRADAAIAECRKDTDALVEVLEGCVKYEQERAQLSGFSDCTCINFSRDREREYETGTCPHQKARALLASLKTPETEGAE